MNFQRLTINVLVVFVFTLAFAALAQAQIQRTFVSTAGADTGNCIVSAPCRNFSYALTQTAVGGELIALNSGGYGVMTITQAVSVIAPDGVYAGITASSGTAVTVNAPGAAVILRGLNINRQGSGFYGIVISAVSAVHIEGCVVSGFEHGIQAGLTASADIFIKDTIVRHSVLEGISITGPFAGGTLARVSMVNTRSERNGQNGFSLGGNVRATLDQCIASGNGLNGFSTYTGPAGVVAEVNADNCVASNNSTGFDVFSYAGGGTSTLRVSRSVATNNSTYGFQQSGPLSTFETLQGTNIVRGNTTNRSGTITTVNPDTP